MSTAPVPNFALASFSQAGSFAQDPLLTDGDDVVSRIGTVASGGGKLYRGQIVNIDPATGAIITAVLGTAAPNAIVAENCDATSATVQCLVYLSGKFSAAAILWPPTGGHAAITDVLRDYGILIESAVARDGTLAKSVPTVEEEKAEKKLAEARKKEEEEAAKEKAVPPPSEPEKGPHHNKK